MFWTTRDGYRISLPDGAIRRLAEYYELAPARLSAYLVEMGRNALRENLSPRASRYHMPVFTTQMNGRGARLITLPMPDGTFQIRNILPADDLLPEGEVFTGRGRTKGSLPVIPIGEIKPVSQTSAGVSQLINRRQFNRRGGALITYDPSGQVTATYYDRNTNVRGKVPVGQIPNMPAHLSATQLGNWVEGPIRAMLSGLTGQTYLTHNPSANGPDIIPK